jgi:hypothetical protein
MGCAMVTRVIAIRNLPTSHSFLRDRCRPSLASLAQRLTRLQSKVDVGIFRRLLSIPHDIVMDLNNVMFVTNKIREFASI